MKKENLRYNFYRIKYTILGILNALKNILTFNEKSKAICKYRSAVCENCMHKKKYKCGICGCFLFLKKRCTKEDCYCPIGKWLDNDTVLDKNELRNRVTLIYDSLYAKEKDKYYDSIISSLNYYQYVLNSYLLLAGSNGDSETELKIRQIMIDFIDK